MKKGTFVLNPEQQAAVDHAVGPLLVVAGAGTGKTRVITERIKKLIQHDNLPPEKLLALTFTDKAAAEMLARLDTVMPLGYTEPWVDTFHSFCDRVLKLEGLEIGLNPSYKILSYSDQWVLVRRHLFDFELDYYRPLSNPTKAISALLKFVSRLQDENTSVEDLQSYVESYVGEPEEIKRWKELSSFYKKYTELKLQQSAMDFGDLIVWTIKLFKERNNILNRYKKQFTHVLVDEFQDTNYAQYELIKLLSPSAELEVEKRSLMVVGDDSQSIYKFRGAAVSNILDFRADYPNTTMLTLLTNYRSSQAILDPAYSLIQKNNPDTLEIKLNISKELVSSFGADFSGSIKPEIIELDTLESEAEFIVKKILLILGQEPSYSYKDFAILARANNHLDPFIMALRRHGLPYQLVGNRGLYDTDEVRNVIALLRILVDPYDAISLYRILNLQHFNISPDLISKILAEVKKERVDLWDKLVSTPVEEVQSFLKLFEDYRGRLASQTPSQLTYELVHAVGMIKRLTSEESLENELRLKNLDLFLEKIKKFELSHYADTREIATVVDLVNYIDLMLEAGDSPAQAEIQDYDTVQLMTTHASKGLEYPVVFMINLVSGRFPTRNRSDAIDLPDSLVKERLPSGDAHLQEERRLFYVGMTRAKKYLYLTYAKSYGGKRNTVPSGYLAETKIETTQLSSQDFEGAESQSTLFDKNSVYRKPKPKKNLNEKKLVLSYSKMESYLSCPFRYRYEHVLNVPTPSKYSLSFGNTIHNTLRDYHMKKLVSPSVKIEDVLQMYKANWDPTGYQSKEQREGYYKKGEDVLKKYFEVDILNSAKTFALEKNFYLSLDQDKTLNGRIDRIDRLDSEDGVNEVEIIDYKTGQSKSQKEVDENEQVTIYALAAKEVLKLVPKKLTLYFVEHNEKVSTTRTLDQLEAIKTKALAVFSKIQDNKFDPTPGHVCKLCPYSDICPHAQKVSY